MGLRDGMGGRSCSIDDDAVRGKWLRGYDPGGGSMDRDGLVPSATVLV